MIWLDGMPRHGGAFSVPTCLPYLLQLATLTFGPSARARVSKRDARHYFHSLRISRRWRPYHAIPPVRRIGMKQHVRVRGWAMGCKLSATLAQAVCNAAARTARIPLARRLLPGNPCPGEPPVWGSIIDDL